MKTIAAAENQAALPQPIGHPPSSNPAFRHFAEPVQARWKEMSRGELYVVGLSKDYMKESYLASFPEGTNPLFKTRTEFDCSSCNNFIGTLGRVVAIAEGGNLLTVWDNHASMPYPYNVVSKRLSELVSAAPIAGVFRTRERQYGVEHNFDSDGRRRNHFHGAIADRHWTREPSTDCAEFDARAKVFGRGLSEIQPHHLDTVIDLINENSLYRGEEHKPALVAFSELQAQWIAGGRQESFIWSNCHHFASRLRNTVIGTLLIDLANHMELEQAVAKFEAMVAPANYKRPTALITKTMVEQAVAKLKELGLESAIERRCATIEDVSIEDVIWANRDAKSKMKNSSPIAELLEPETRQKSCVASTTVNATPISAAKFFNDVVPSARSIEVLFENKHLSNLVSITAPANEGEPRLFKWNNDFAWSYVDEAADAIKQRVKKAGGKVDALFRASLAWHNYDDLDLHAHTPHGEHIYYAHRRGYSTAGQLDIDMNAGSGTTREPVENIFWNDRRRLADGPYIIDVKQFSKRESVDAGFELELEFDGEVVNFTYDKPMRTGEVVRAIEVTVKGGRLAGWRKLREDIVVGSATKEKWGLTTGQRVEVGALMLSPNHWGDQAVGNKHHIFILEGAANPDPVRGIYNEFLRPELNHHRKVWEVLGGKSKAEPNPNGLHGLGFSSTRNDEVSVWADGRPYLVQF